jgi:AraC-like DNA-binding protein/ligand-binding sensor domain-containing protein/signal transduction histidine kinase
MILLSSSARACVQRAMRPLRCRPLGVLLLALLGVQAGALEGQSVLPPPTHRATWWTTSQGLPGNFMRDLSQSQDGRLWVIAGGVLSRFDGREFELVAVPEEVAEGRVSDRIAGWPALLAAAGGDSLWLAGRQGDLFLRSRGVWTRVLRTERLVTSLEAVPGQLPILQTFDFSGNQFFRGGEPLDPGPRLYLHHPEWPSSSLWLGPTGAAWAILDGGASIGSLTGPEQHALPQGRIVGHPSHPGPLVAVVSPQGLIVQDMAGEVVATLPEVRDGEVLHVTRDRRVAIVREERLEVHRSGLPGSGDVVATGIGPGEITAFLEDAEGGLWVATRTRGLLQVREAPFQEVGGGGRPNDSIYTDWLAEGSGGSVLMLGEGGLFRIHGDSVSPVRPLRAPPFLQIGAALEDRSGALWLGLHTGAQDLLYREGANGVVWSLPLEALPARFRESVRTGELLWVQDHIYCTASIEGASTGPVQPRCRAAELGRLRDILRDREGTLWVAGELGLLADRDGALQRYTPAEGHEAVLARALLEDPDGGIWIGTYFGGLGLLRGDTLRWLRSDRGLVEDVASSLLLDSEDRIWMGGNRSIHSVHRREALEHFAGTRPRVLGVALDGRHGISNAETSGWGAAADGEGRLWFPTFGGAVGVHPGRTGTLALRPGRVTFDNTTSEGATVPTADTVRLPLGVRSVTVGVGSVSLNYPQARFLEYRLNQRTQDEVGWEQIETGRALVLSALGPGVHQLEVRSLHAGAAGEPSLARMWIEVPPRFSETWAYKLLLLFLFGLAAGALVWLRTRALEARAESLRQEVDEQTYWLRVENERTAVALERAAEVTARFQAMATSKTEAFSSLTREIGAPVAVLQGWWRGKASRGIADASSRAEVEGALQTLVQVGSKFGALAGDRFDALMVELNPADFSGFVHRTLSEARTMVTAHGVRLEEDLPEGSVPVSFDSDQMKRVLESLLIHVNHLTSPGGGIAVRLRTEEALGPWAVLEFLVEGGDSNGEATYPALARVHEDTAESHDEPGPELALARTVIDLHGGTLRERMLEHGDTAGAWVGVLEVRLPLDPILGSSEDNPPSALFGPLPEELMLDRAPEGSDPDGLGTSESLGDPFLQRLYGVIHERLSNPDLDVDQMAQALYVSRSSLYRELREHLHCSPMDLLMRIRLDEAARLLADEALTIQAVAEAVGFRRQSHFTRRFTAHFGESPSTFRMREHPRNSGVTEA